MTATWYCGDTRTVLRTLPDASVDLVLTSPPFLALRSYLPADDPNKALEMGSEATPGEFLDALLDVVVECRRVLAPHGSLCFELGDTYAGSGGAGGDYGDEGLRAGQPKFRARTDGGRYVNGYSGGTKGNDVSGSNGAFDVRPIRGKAGWPLDKSLCLIPESFRWALAYGRNPFTGRTIEPWRVRNVVRWCRPNPPVGALADKFRPATSEMVIACTGRSRYFDLDAVRTEPQVQMGRAVAGNNVKGSDEQSMRFAERIDSNPAGAPPLDWWRIPTQPYRGSHYATWPEDLCITPILAMCPQKVCTVCGEPSRRLTQPSDGYAEHLGESWADRGDGRTKANGRERNSHSGQPKGAHITAADRRTLGWSDCGHDAWRPGVTLDPFAGSGTTLAVAVGHGRHAIGIDLDERNYHLARERIGMWLELADGVPA